MEVENITVEHIIVETGLGKGIEEYGNMGDVSMLQVAVDRLHELYPNARIEVLTDSSENLLRFCPAAVPLDHRGRALWFSDGVVPGRYRNLIPGLVVKFLVQVKRTVRLRFPALLRALLLKRLKRQNRSQDAESLEAFTRAFERANLVVICGAGGFYDGCQGWNMDILDLIEASSQRNIPAVLLGQGFGPLSSPSVLKRAAKILPLARFITLRGGRGSLDLLRSLGISESKVQTTGDEALELAYESRASDPGKALGINIRFLASAWTDQNDLESIRPVLHEFARRHNVPLIPLPIAIHLGTRDDLAIKQLLSGFDDQSDGGAGLDSPFKVIKQVGLCRVIVTGAYHAAVFALGQGIPVIALAKSEYFSRKLLGLEDQFGEGCQTLLLNEPDLPRRLQSAIEKAWQNADKMREPIHRVTLRQIELSRRSYGKLRGLVPGDFKITANRFVQRRPEAAADTEPRNV